MLFKCWVLHNYGLLIKVQFNYIYPRIQYRPLKGLQCETAHFAKVLRNYRKDEGMGNISNILRLITKRSEQREWLTYEMSDKHWERSFMERGGRKSNCIPGLGVILEGVTLISPLVVYINRHVRHEEENPPLCKQPPSKTAHAFWNLYLWSAERPIMKMFRGAITANIPTVGL